MGQLLMDALLAAAFALSICLVQYLLPKFTVVELIDVLELRCFTRCADETFVFFSVTVSSIRMA